MCVCTEHIKKSNQRLIPYTDLTCESTNCSSTSRSLVLVCLVWFVYRKHVVRQDNNSINKMEMQNDVRRMRMEERRIRFSGEQESILYVSVSLCLLLLGLIPEKCLSPCVSES